MAYVAPTIRSVGDAVTAADYNIMANDVLDHETRILALPRGYKGSTALATSFSTASTSPVDVPGLSVTFTAESSRRYLVSLNGSTNNSGGAIPGQILINDGTIDIAEAYHAPINNAVQQLNTFAFTSPSAGSVTYKVRIQTVSGTIDIFGANTRASLAARLLVMDIGPV